MDTGVERDTDEDVVVDEDEGKSTPLSFSVAMVDRRRLSCASEPKRAFHNVQNDSRIGNRKEKYFKK